MRKRIVAVSFRSLWLRRIRFILQMLGLIEECKIAVDDLLKVFCRSTLKAAHKISAASLAIRGYEAELRATSKQLGIPRQS